MRVSGRQTWKFQYAYDAAVVLVRIIELCVPFTAYLLK